MGGRLATCSIVAVGLGFALVLVPGRAWAGEDDLVLDLGSASDKPSEAGAGLRKLELRRIQKGTFVEGSPASDAYREPDEVQRNVTISKTFWMGKYPITRGQFTRFVAETRHQTDAEKGQSGGFGWDGVRLKQSKEYTWRNPGFTQSDDDPVTLVTFGDANAFTAWASRKTGRRVRLPTEAEFEFAARGGTTTPWFAAKSEDEANVLGWYRPLPGQAVGTHAVGKKKANPFGLYDMTGNVNQWCRDVYAMWPPADVTDPENTTNATSEPERRVLRGGSWMREPRRGRSAARFRNTPGTRNADNGFRVVVEDAPVIAPAPGAATSADLAPSAMPASDNQAAPPLIDAGPMIQATPVIQRPPSTEGFSWTLFAAPAAGIAFVVAWMLARRKKEATNEQGITTRAGEDGFWVRAPSLPPNSRVRYTCIVKGSEVSDIVPLDGGEETFVFTGGAPSLIHISEAPAVPDHRSSARMPVAPPIPPPSSAPPATPASVSPWPSDRGMPVASAPPPPPPVLSTPPMPSRPPTPPPPPSSAPLGLSTPVALRPPIPPSSPSAPPAAPSSRAPLAPSAPSTPPAAPSSRAPLAPSTPPTPPSSRAPLAPSSSRAPIAPSVPPPLPSSRPSASRAPAALSRPPVPLPSSSRAPVAPKAPEPFLLPPVEDTDDDDEIGDTVLAEEPAPPKKKEP